MGKKSYFIKILYNFSLFDKLIKTAFLNKS